MFVPLNIYRRNFHALVSTIIGKESGMANLILAFGSFLLDVGGLNLGFKAMLKAIGGSNKDYLGMLRNC
jgi:hypothetical protein